MEPKYLLSVLNLKGSSSSHLWGKAECINLTDSNLECLSDLPLHLICWFHFDFSLHLKTFIQIRLRGNSSDCDSLKESDDLSFHS